MKNKVTDKKLHDYIHEVLIRRADLRDSDSSLITHIWWREAKEQGIDLEKINAFNFLKLLQAEKFTSTESIRRTRQKVQEQYAETRGLKYLDRLAKALEIKQFYRKEAA